MLITANVVDTLRARLEATGLNLWGVVDARRFDATEPPGRRLRDRLRSCRSALVVGSGGRSLWDRMVANRGVPGEPDPTLHPLETFAQGLLEQACRELVRAGVRARLVMPWGACRLNFRRLGEAAGLGIVSPVLNLLLHPTFGPWVSLRGAILTDAHVTPSEVLDDFHPCAMCYQPCRHACPAHVFDVAALAFDRCHAHRVDGGCISGCEARRRCPLGSEHRYGEDEERFRHSYSFFLLHERFGSADAPPFGRA